MEQHIDINGAWTGKLIYLTGVDENAKGKEMQFKVAIYEKDGEVTGKSVDIKGHGFVPEEASIEGFIEDDMISFIKKYPACYEPDGNGNMVKVEDREPYEINFSAIYDKENNKFSGSWDMLIKSHQIGFSFYDEMIAGEWEMQKAV